MLKKILIGVGALLLLIVIGLVALVMFFDVDHYKPQIEKVVHDRLNRTLKIDGKLSLSVFPAIALALPHTTLSEHASDKTFLNVDRARISLAVLPLLSGRIEAGTVSLYGLRAEVERHADGTTSIDDLTGGPKTKTAEPSPPPAPSGHRGVPALEVGGIDIVDAQVTYRDDKSHETTSISRLNLKVGHLAARAKTPIDFSAAIDASAPKTHLDLALKTTADVNLEGKAFGLRKLEAHVRGSVGDDRVDIGLTSPLLQIDPVHTVGDSLKLIATVAGAHQAKVGVELDKISGNGEQISAGALKLDLDAEQGPQKVSAVLTSPVQVGVASETIELPKLAGEVNLQSPTLPQKALKVKLDGSLRVESKAQNLAAKLNAHFDESNAATKVAVQGFSSPHIAFDAQIDRLNLDRYLPPSAPAEPGAKPADTPAPAAAAADPKVDLAALKPLSLSGEARIGALQAHNMKATQLKVGVHAAGGHMEVAPIAAKLYEGALDGNVKIDADGNRIAPKLALEGISIHPLLKDLMGKDILEGHGNVKMDVAMAGPTVGAMKRALAGTASMSLKDGAVRGINLGQKVREFKSALSGGGGQAQSANANEKTDFSELSASFNIKNGVAANNDLLAKSPLLRLGGAGNIDIGASTIDYTAKVSVVETLAGQGGSELSGLRGVTIPVHLTGPFTALSYKLDWGSIATQQLKNQAAGKVQELLGGKLKQGGQTPNVGAALKGLLGKERVLRQGPETGRAGIRAPASGGSVTPPNAGFSPYRTAAVRRHHSGLLHTKRDS
jgi:AsmA protein